MWKPSLAVVSSLLLFLGFAVSAAGILLANRWVKKPRPEIALDDALKSLSDHHRLYHYVGPWDHLLLTPGGLVAIETVNLDGRFTYLDGKWKQKISFNRAIRFIFEPRLGNPIDQALKVSQSVKRNFEELIAGTEKVPVDALVVFTHPAAELEVKSNPIPVTIPKKLAKQLPKNQPRLSAELYRELQAHLDRMIEGE